MASDFSAGIFRDQVYKAPFRPKNFRLIFKLNFWIHPKTRDVNLSE
jgi:hypothetical protein